MFGKKIIYFDNSATTNTKPAEVQKQCLMALKNLSANPGRSGHSLSILCAEKVFEAREKLAAYTGGDKVVFTSNCTEALNLAILSYKQPGGHIVLTENEHNSTLRPTKWMCDNYDMTYSVARCDSSGIVNADEIENLIKPNTCLVVCNAISNVNGDEADIENIAKVCKNKNIPLLVDGAQSIGHKKVDYFSLGVNMLAVAPHKGLYAMQGVGALVVDEGAHLRPLKFGGTGTSSLDLLQPADIPEGFECGTLPSANIFSVSAGIDFVEQNQSRIESTLKELTRIAISGLVDLGYDVYTKRENGVVAFNHKMHDSSIVSDYLNTNNICTRGGLHCAPIKHMALGTTKKGAVRVSFSVFNTQNEVEEFLQVMKKLK